MRLDKIKIEGFKSISSTILDIKPINVLIGGNGSGKSNFIEAFTFLREITEGNLARYVKINGGADRLLHFGTKSTKEIRLHVFFNSDVNQYEISLEPHSSDGLFKIDEKKTKIDAASAMKSWRVYHFHDTGFSSPLKRLSNIDDNRFLRDDGSNLASFLYRLKELHVVEYKIIRNTMRRIVRLFSWTSFLSLAHWVGKLLGWNGSIRSLIPTLMCRVYPMGRFVFWRSQLCSFNQRN